MSAGGGLSYWLLASILMRIWICNFEFIKMEHNCLWMSWLQDRFEYTSADVGTGKQMGAITNPYLNQSNESSENIRFRTKYISRITCYIQLRLNFVSFDFYLSFSWLVKIYPTSSIYCWFCDELNKHHVTKELFS